MFDKFGNLELQANYCIVAFLHLFIYLHSLKEIDFQEKFSFLKFEEGIQKLVFNSIIQFSN